MKLKDIYFINNPDDEINDSISIRILTEPDPGENTGYEYALQATTLEFIRNFMETKDRMSFCGYGEPVLIVRRLNDEFIHKAVEEILPHIDKMAKRIE